MDTATAALSVAVVSGLIALWNGKKTNDNAVDLASLRSAVDRDLERLKAKLAHGQLINSSQWNAEFAAYQAILNGMVAVRTLATKLVLREEELIDLGVPDGYLASPKRIEIRKNLIQEFAKAAEVLLLAVHGNAPFYPANVRETANETHKSAKKLFDKNMSALTRLNESVDLFVDKQFIGESKILLAAITEGSDTVEALIRERLAAVQVVNSAAPND